MSQRLMEFEYPTWLRVDGERFSLEEVDTRHRCDPGGERLKRKHAEAQHRENVEVLKKLQFLMHAERKRSLLIVFQGIDAAGKDGAIRRTLGPLNPQGVRVQSFKVPTERERDQDFLWRVHRHAPQKGFIKVFNRSHYEDVLVVRVHEMVPEVVWQRRFGHINHFEALLADNDTIIVKFLLHISKEEQRERLQERLDNPERTWKFSSADLRERGYWDQYMEAFEDTVKRTSTRVAPWYVIPADRKWFRNYAISTILRQVLEGQEMEFPAPEEGLEGLVVQ